MSRKRARIMHTSAPDRVMHGVCRLSFSFERCAGFQRRTGFAHSVRFQRSVSVAQAFRPAGPALLQSLKIHDPRATPQRELRAYDSRCRMRSYGFTGRMNLSQSTLAPGWRNWQTLGT